MTRAITLTLVASLALATPCLGFHPFIPPSHASRFDNRCFVTSNNNNEETVGLTTGQFEMEAFKQRPSSGLRQRSRSPKVWK